MASLRRTARGGGALPVRAFAAIRIRGRRCGRARAPGVQGSETRHAVHRKAMEAPATTGGLVHGADLTNDTLWPHGRWRAHLPCVHLIPAPEVLKPLRCHIGSYLGFHHTLLLAVFSVLMGREYTAAGHSRPKTASVVFNQHRH